MNKFDQNITYISLLILFITTLWFVWNDAVLTWPAIDNLSAAKRLLDSDFLRNDFLTNANSEISPKSPFIFCIVAIKYVFGNFFNAKYFEEFSERQMAIEGNGFETNFYRDLSPNEFINISKKFRIDYVVIESKFSSKFHLCEYVYVNNEFHIYTLEALVSCIDKAP